MLYVLEVPHRLPPKAWVAKNKNDFCEKVLDTSNSHYGYHCFNDIEEITYFFDEDEEEGKEYLSLAKSIIEKYKSVIINNWQGEFKIYIPKDAPSKEYFCREVLKEDNKHCIFLDEKEAKEMIKSKNLGFEHQYFKALDALKAVV